MSEAATGGSRILSVREWHDLALAGQWLPMRFQVHGNSMRPLIRKERDTVVLLPMDRAPRVGDVVLFPAGETYVLHRVWKVKDGLVRTFGDGCRRPDGWIPAEDVWGQAQFVRRGKLRIDLGKRRWRALGRLWMFLWPVRGVLFQLERAVGIALGRSAPRREGQSTNDENG